MQFKQCASKTLLPKTNKSIFLSCLLQCNAITRQKRFHKISLNQPKCISFQETVVTAVLVETEAFVPIKLTDIGAVAELVTLDQHVQQVSEIFN